MQRWRAAPPACEQRDKNLTMTALPAIPELVARRDEVREFFGGRPVLVTGGAGFIGSNLSRALVALGANVTVLDSMAPNYGGNAFNLHDVARELRFIEGDVCDARDTAKLVRDFDCVFNMVGQVSHVDSMEDPLTDLLRTIPVSVILNPAAGLLGAARGAASGN